MRIIIFLVASISFAASFTVYSQEAYSGSDKVDVLNIQDEILLKQSLYHTGDLSRIKTVLTKAERGEDIVVGVIGGSITMGASASTAPEDRWANLVAKWFCDKYPDITVRFYNAGIGATNSTFGAMRAWTDLLQYKPDFVVFEYSINDNGNERRQESSEGLLRQLLNSEPNPGVVMLGMMNRWGDNVQDKHLPLAQHYDIPFVSFRNVCEPLIKEGSISPEQVLADAVHPNTTGHLLTAKIINLVLESAYNSENRSKTEIEKLPAPLFTDMFENVEFMRAPDMKFKLNKGWELIAHDASLNAHWRLHGKRIIGKVWNTTEIGSKLEFEYEGTFLSLSYYVYKATIPKANIKVIIDGKNYGVVKGTGEQTWGGLSKTIILGEELTLGKHEVVIELLPSEGIEDGENGFDIVALGFGTK